MIHECERCHTNSSVFWHTLGYGCSETGDGAIKVFEFCDGCLFDLIKFMERERPKYHTNRKRSIKEDSQ